MKSILRSRPSRRSYSYSYSYSYTYSYSSHSSRSQTPFGNAPRTETPFRMERVSAGAEPSSRALLLQNLHPKIPDLPPTHPRQLRHLQAHLLKDVLNQRQPVRAAHRHDQIPDRLPIVPRLP